MIVIVDCICVERYVMKLMLIVVVGFGIGALLLYLANVFDLNVDVVIVECS